MKKEDISKLISKAHREITRRKGKDYSPDVHEIQKWIDNHLKIQKVEPKEAMGASSSGSFEAPLFGKPILKKDINKIHNSNLEEALAGTAMGTYDVPFLGSTPKGRKEPLKISGPDSIKKSRAVKDKNFPKWGGPGGIFIKIKEKCKKFPYCNQGDINAIEVLRESIEQTSKNTGIPKEEIENTIINEIKLIFIDYENQRY
jgi:hypothetical protein